MRTKFQDIAGHQATWSGRLRCLACGLVGFGLFGLYAAEGAEPANVRVFKSGTDGYHTFRIPVIVRAANGDSLAFAEGRKNGSGDAGDIDIVSKRSQDGGRTWGPMQLVQDEWSEPAAKITIGNPTPVVDQLDPQHPGRIWLVFTRNNARLFVTSSDDHGQTWSQRREITATAIRPEWTWCASGPVHAIQLTRGKHVGRLVIPCDHNTGKNGSTGSHLVYSDDHGANWKLGAVCTHAASDPVHPDECVAVELVGGQIYVNTRDENGSSTATRAVAYSRDGGETFEAPFAAEPNISSPVVQNSLLRFAAQDQGAPENVLIYCGPGDSKARRDLTVRVSRDESKTWQQAMVIHAGPAAYCDLVKLNDREFGVLYEAGAKLYDEILFAVVRLDDLGH